MFDRPFVGTAPDYSDPKNWLVIPENPTYPVDVIYLYPSACTDWNVERICAIDDASMIAQAKNYFEQSGKIFEGVGNIYAPYWRQVSSSFVIMRSPEEVKEAEMEEPRTDVYAALDYYFEHLNNGRPWMIAGHSQGSSMLGKVLAEYMREHPDYYSKMIVAYRVGDGLTKSYLKANPHVKAAQSADDLGVCASWNTEGPANLGKHSLVVPPECVAINPLNWRVDETPAGEELCLGCFFPVYGTPDQIPLEEKVSTVLNLERGVVLVTNPEMQKYSIVDSDPVTGKMSEPIFGPSSFHNCDYSFFYYNVRENAKLRAKVWLDTHEK